MGANALILYLPLSMLHQGLHKQNMPRNAPERITMRAVQKGKANMQQKLNSLHSGRLSLLFAVALSLVDLANDRTKSRPKQKYVRKKRLK